MPTGNFQIDLKASSGNAIVQAIDVNQLLNAELSKYTDYIPLLGEFVLECCDVSTEIVSLPSVPVPNIDDLEDTKAMQAAKIHEIWSNYPKIGLQLWLDTGNGIWRKQGQAIVLQNRPFQLPINVLKPYLSSINDFKLLGKKARLGAQIISGSEWSQLSINDEVSIKGDWRFTLELKEVLSEPLKNWYSISENLIEGEAKTIRPFNEKRRGLTLTNDGLNKIYIYFGSTSVVSELTGILLNPGGSASFLTDKFYVPSEISAISIGGSSRLIGMEGIL